MLRFSYWPLATVLCVLAMAGCPRPERQPLTLPEGSQTAASSSEKAAALTGGIEIDGSSTVFPITEAVAEEFQQAHAGVKVTVGISGTGGGFKRFVAGETAVQNASRPIKDSEDAAASEQGIAYIELPVAFDGLTVVVNPANDWVDHLTVAELKKIWEPGSTVKSWADVRSGWPAQPLKLYGPGTDSGTFDYFTEAVVGEAKQSRSDYTASEDDNVLVTGVAGDRYALGYFGLAYYEENADKVKSVPVDGGSGPVSASEATVMSGEYAPLSRPLFIYVTTSALQRPEVAAFIDFYLENVPSLAAEVGYIALPTEAYEAISAHLADGKTGSSFMGKNTVGLTIQAELEAEQ